MEAGTFKGARGEMKHVYRIAAEVRAFVITFDKTTKRGTLGGAVGTSDPFLLMQRPLVFSVWSKVGTWRWPVESVKVANGQIRATLGPLLQGE